MKTTFEFSCTNGHHWRMQGDEQEDGSIVMARIHVTVSASREVLDAYAEDYSRCPVCKSFYHAFREVSGESD